MWPLTLPASQFLTLFFSDRNFSDQQDILRLCYGTSTPSLDQGQYFLVDRVARYLHVQRQRAHRLHETYFSALRSRRRRFADVSEEAIKYAVSWEALKDMAELNLEERARLLTSRFEDSIVTASTLKHL